MVEKFQSISNTSLSAPNCIKEFLNLPCDSGQTGLTSQLFQIVILANQVWRYNCNVKPDWSEQTYCPMKMLYTIGCWRLVVLLSSYRHWGQPTPWKSIANTQTKCWKLLLSFPCSIIIDDDDDDILLQCKEENLQKAFGKCGNITEVKLPTNTGKCSSNCSLIVCLLAESLK